MYLLDELTTGPHPADVELLMRQLHGLVDAGRSVLVIAHEMSVVSGADRMIDLGPGGGDTGGGVVATGRPTEVAGADGSRTAPYPSRRLTG